MDYSIAAMKLLCTQLKDARETPNGHAMDLHAIVFQRAWLQGVLVDVSTEGDRLLLDDGTGVVELFLRPEFPGRDWEIGMYVMAVGRYLLPVDEPPVIQIHKLVDLSAFPDREAMWYLEVLEAFKMYYQPLMA